MNNNRTAMPADARAKLPALRHAVAKLEGAPALVPERGRLLCFGLPSLDTALGGGLARGAVHELAPTALFHLGAASGFALMLAALAGKDGRSTLWIQPDFAALAGGAPYGPGLDLIGLPMRQVIVLRVTRARDALWAMEEALKCRSIATVITEFADDGAAADLTATRRLALAAGHSGALGLLLRHRSSPLPSAAMTRWEIAAALGARDAFGGLGITTFILSLTKNRRGPTGRWLLSWDHHERAFVSAALSLGMAETASNRSDRTFSLAG